MTGSQRPILELQDLVLSFRESGRGKDPRVQALGGVSLKLLEGECLALVGESGAGKTTLARAILRLIPVDGGRIFYRGRDVLSMGMPELGEFRRRVQIVFQDPFGSLNPRIRVGKSLEEVLKVHGDDVPVSRRRERALELLALVGLGPETFDRFPHEFSGGQRQRVGIARSLSVQPEVLVLDEPVSALDLSVQAQILNLLKDLQKELRLTYVFITHDLSVVRQMADRVGVLYLGRVVEVGATEEVFSEPLHPYTRGLLTLASPLEGTGGGDGDWTILPGEPPNPANPPPGCAFHPRCPHPGKGPECSVSRPPLTSWEKGRTAACWKLGKHMGDP